MRTDLGEDADAVWGHCSGYPGRADAPAFAAYFRNHQVESALFFGAYGDQTVAQVRANLARRTRLIEFAMAAQGLAPAELQARFQAEFPRMTDALELDSIQGFVVRGYRLPSAGYLFLRIDDAARARALLAETTPDVLTADPWETKPESGINIAFTLRRARGDRRPRHVAGRLPRGVRAPGWRRAATSWATSARARRSTGRRRSAAARSTCW